MTRYSIVILVIPDSHVYIRDCTGAMSAPIADTKIFPEENWRDSLKRLLDTTDPQKFLEEIAY